MQKTPLGGKGGGEQDKQEALTLQKHVCREHANKSPLHQQFQGLEFNTALLMLPSKHLAFINTEAVQSAVEV